MEAVPDVPKEVGYMIIWSIIRSIFLVVLVRLEETIKSLSDGRSRYRAVGLHVFVKLIKECLIDVPRLIVHET